MLNELRQKNPDLMIYDVRDTAFLEYGNVIESMDTAEIVRAAGDIELPQEGALYLPSAPELERLKIAAEIRDRYFGTLPAQIGYCCGHSNFLNAAEWHASNEVNVAVTPLVLILGKRSDMKNNRLSSSSMKAFYVPAGTALEVYASTLHFCPCEVQGEGFGCVVALPVDTNTPLDGPSEDPLLFRKNKWIVAHDQNRLLIERGVVPGIDGVNYEIRY